MILDSGARRTFDSGAVRDITENKGRCDLLPLDVVAKVLGDPLIKQVYEFQNDGDVGHLVNALGCFTAKCWDGCPYTMLLEVAIHFGEGCEKYGERNWQKGINAKNYTDSTIRHYLKWLRADEDESHDRAVAWNLLCAIWTCKHKPELNDYAIRNENICVCCGESIPEGTMVCDVCLKGEDNGHI